MNVDEAWGIYRDRRCLCHREELILAYLPLVRRVVSQMRKKIPRYVETDDLVSYGTAGLIRAVERFDPDIGVTFETYASANIRGSLLDELRALDWAPRSLRRKHRAIKAAAEDLRRRHEREVTVEEIAVQLLISADDVRSVLSQVEAVTHYSLDDNFSDDGGEGRPYYEHVLDAAAVSPDQEAEGGEVYEALIALIGTMSWQERTLIAMYYFGGATLADISVALGVPESRVSQIHKRSVLRLREVVLQGFSEDP